MEEAPEIYVKRIKQLRNEAGYTQDYVASYLDISQTMYARYERAANELPLRHFMRLCKLYDVPAGYILGMEER